MAASNLCVSQVVSLREHVAGRGPPVKTLHVVNPAQLGGLTLPEILGLQAAPQGTKFILRYEETAAAKRRLLEQCHPAHAEQIGQDEEGQPVFRDVEEVQTMFEQNLFDFVGSPGFVEVPPRPPPETNPLDWFTRHGPRLQQISSLVTPDLENRLPPGWKALSKVSSTQVHLNMGCLNDPANENGPSSPGRSVPLDDSMWLQSRLSSFHRGGLASDPEQMLAHHAVSLFEK